MINVVTFLFPRFSENSYLVFDETKECLIIDPGCYTKDEQEEILEYIDFIGLKPILLINTHCHLDHVIGNQFMLEHFDIPLALHETELRFLKAMPSYAKKYDLEFVLHDQEIVFLKEGQKIKVGHAEFLVMHTPGHSTGSISLFCATDNVLISGDVLFKNRIGRVDLPGGNLDILKKTLEEKIFPIGDEVVVYPGHGPSTQIGYEKAYNTFVCDWI